MREAEVIVVGGGHNGLICAAYLAGASVNTLLLEARPSVGGCASTVDDLTDLLDDSYCIKVPPSLTRLLDINDG